jgi:hypothetical protein
MPSPTLTVNMLYNSAQNHIYFTHYSKGSQLQILSAIQTDKCGNIENCSCILVNTCNQSYCPGYNSYGTVRALLIHSYQVVIFPNAKNVHIYLITFHLTKYQWFKRYCYNSSNECLTLLLYLSALLHQCT